VHVHDAAYDCQNSQHSAVRCPMSVFLCAWTGAFQRRPLLRTACSSLARSRSFTGTLAALDGCPVRQSLSRALSFASADE